MLTLGLCLPAWSGPGREVDSGSVKVGWSQKTDWDQVANIKQAAKRIALLQRRRGAGAAMTLISSCYKTHTLFQDYSRGFEACLVQDHIETRVLVEIYSRLRPELLKRIGAPSQGQLLRSNAARFAASLGKYKAPAAYASRFRALVDKHGWPVFLKIVFPKAGQQQRPATRAPKN